MLPPTGGLNLPQARDDPGREAFTHRLFLGSARGAPTQDEGLDAVAIRTTLDFQSFTQRFQYGCGAVAQPRPHRPCELFEATAHIAALAQLRPGPRSNTQIRPFWP